MVSEEWTKKLTEVRDLVAKGYSLETPRWMVGDHIRGLMRAANQEGNAEVYDLLVFEMDAWNRKQ